MTYVNPPDDVLRAILEDAKTIAVVGASSKPGRASHDVFRRLQHIGYRVIPVNPHETAVLGEKAYPSLEAVPEPVDIVNVFRRAEATPAIAESAVIIGAKVLWLQEGVWNETAAAHASARGLGVVMDLCIAVVYALVV